MEEAHEYISRLQDEVHKLLKRNRELEIRVLRESKPTNNVDDEITEVRKVVDEAATKLSSLLARLKTERDNAQSQQETANMLVYPLHEQVRQAKGCLLALHDNAVALGHPTRSKNSDTDAVPWYYHVGGPSSTNRMQDVLWDGRRAPTPAEVLDWVVANRGNLNQRGIVSSSSSSSSSSSFPSSSSSSD